MKFFKVCT